MPILRKNNSYIWTIEKTNGHTNDYYQYILSVLEYIIDKNNLSINIILDGNEYNFNNNNKTIKISINYEHTLVKEGGRSVQKDTPFGKIKYNENKNYFVRIDRFQHLNSSDIIIDYSQPNIFNVKKSGLFNDFSNKHIYIAPCLYKNIYINAKNRKIPSLTTFINVNEPRRKKLLVNITQSTLKHGNINNCFDKHKLQELYQNTKVVINIRQTPHHDTFEELRCLPALQNGVIVVSEKSPLSHLVPYNELIIWTDYDNIINKTKEVLENYEEYHKKIFTEKNIKVLYKMDDKNKQIMKDKIITSITSEYLKKKIIIYIHIACLNTYEDIFMNLVNYIKESKLYDVVYEIRCGVLGIQSQTFKNFIDKFNKIKIVKEDENLKLYENFTINKIIEDSKIEDVYILYLHTKGCTKPNNININSWVNYLCYFNIEQWKICLNYLENCDMVGVNLQDKSSEELHYAGNFWWTKSDYIKYMEKIIDKSYNASEFHMTKDGLGKFIGLWHSSCPHYNKEYPRKLYENKKILPYELTASKKTLNNLANKYRLDKVLTHNYIPGYEKMFKYIRYKIKNLLEIGIGSVENNQMCHVSSIGYKTGNSLKCWEEYFPNAHIYGIDIYAHSELNKDRIMTFVANQNNDQNLKSVIDKINSPLDIIIDDGSHRGQHQVFSFMYLNKYLAPNGIYVIEDVQPSNIEGFKNLSIFPEHFKEYINQNFVVECFDTRNSCNRYRADDFMISFIKK